MIEVKSSYISGYHISKATVIAIAGLVVGMVGCKSAPDASVKRELTSAAGKPERATFQHDSRPRPLFDDISVGSSFVANTTDSNGGGSNARTTQDAIDRSNPVTGFQGPTVPPVTIARNREGRNSTTSSSHPSIAITRHSEPAPFSSANGSGEVDSLESRLTEALAELAEFDGKPEAELALGDRLRKYKVQVRLIALHYLLPTGSEPRYLDPLLRSLEAPADPPCKSHALMVASFYHDIDQESLRDRTLARLEGRSEALRPVEPEVAEQKSSLEVENLTSCSSVQGFRNFTPVKRTLKGGEQIVLYGELDGLTNHHDKTNQQYQTGIEATAHVYDDRGRELRRIPLTRPGGEKRPHAKPIIENIFQFPFQVPRGLDGRYRLVVEIRDLFSDSVARAEQAIKVRK